MRYTEVNFLVTPVEPWRDVLMVELTEIGFEGFEETPHGIKAFIPTADLEPSTLRALSVPKDPHVAVTYTVHEVPEMNWNARWEKEFLPVEVDGKVLVRAEFHPGQPHYEHEIIITPRMAFGTGHHATTRMMVKAMLDMDLRGKRVCDLGCGTGVLAILAERLGAAEVMAIDYDPVAVENARLNVAMNHCERIVVEKGDADLARGTGYDAILANIERNTLMRSMAGMVASLAENGKLLLSGFIRKDIEVMAKAAKDAGLRHVLTLEEGEWAFSAWEK